MLGVVWVFDADGIVGTAESTFVGIIVLQSSFGGTRGTLVLLVELGRTSNGTNRIYGLGQSEGCDARDPGGDEAR